MVLLLEMKTFLHFHFSKLKLQQKFLGHPPIVSTTELVIVKKNLCNIYRVYQKKVDYFETALNLAKRLEV